MSAHGHGPSETHEDHDGADHDDHDEPLPAEPASPAWLPLLGGALFLVALVVFLVFRTDDAPPEVAAEAVPAASASADVPTARRVAPAAAGDAPLAMPSNLRKLLPPKPGAPLREPPGHEGHGHE